MPLRVPLYRIPVRRTTPISLQGTDGVNVSEGAKAIFFGALPDPRHSGLMNSDFFRDVLVIEPRRNLSCSTHICKLDAITMRALSLNSRLGGTGGGSMAISSILTIWTGGPKNALLL